MERWAKDGWVGTPPYFIARTDAYHILTAPVHLFFCLSFLSVVSSAHNVLACLLPLSPSGVGQNVQYPWRRVGFWISLLAPDWYVSPRTMVWFSSMY